MIRLRLAALPALVALVVASGCTSTAHLRQTERAVAHANPDVRLKRTTHIAVGPFTVGLARMILRASGDAETREIASLLRNVRSARVWVYDIDRAEGAHALRMAPSSSWKGWATLLRATDREDGSTVSIQTREERGRVVGMFVTVIDEDQMVLVDVGGSLDRLVDEAVTRYARSPRDETRSTLPEAPPAVTPTGL